MTTLCRRLLALLGGVVVGIAVAATAGASPAGAHASLQDTSPADDALVEAVPDTLTLRFDEPVSASTGTVQVIAPSGDRVDGPVDEGDGGRSLAVEVEGQALGTYTVAFRVVSDDGHTITGSFVFHAGERTGAATIDQSIPVTTSAVGGVGRWLGYAGAAVAVGAASLLARLGRGSSPDPKPLRRLGTLVAGGAATSALGTAAAVVAQRPPHLRLRLTRRPRRRPRRPLARPQCQRAPARPRGRATRRLGPAPSRTRNREATQTVAPTWQ